jgi:hypothetical protein
MGLVHSSRSKLRLAKDRSRKLRVTVRNWRSRALVELAMRRGLAIVVAVLFTGCAGATGESTPSSATNAASASRSGAAASPASRSGSAILVFQNASPPNYHFSLAAADGSVLRTVDTTAGSCSTWQGDSAALLLFGPNGTHSVLAKDGTIVALPDALNPAFDVTTPNGIGGIAGDPILLDSKTAIGVAGYQSGKYELIDLVSGQISTLLTVITTQPTRGIQPASILPLGTSVDRRTARILVRHATANGTNIPEWAMVEIDIPGQSISGITQLPIQAGLDSFDTFETAVSADGRLLAYQENSKVSAQNVAIYTSRIADIGTGRDTSIADTSIAAYGNSRGLRFSPDGTALLVYGISAPALGPPQESRLALYATSDGHKLDSINVGDSSYNNIAPVGWIGGHTLVYTTTTTNVLGNFTNGDQSAHTLDALTGERHDLPAGLGQLIAVLN